MSARLFAFELPQQIGGPRRAITVGDTGTEYAFHSAATVEELKAGLGVGSEVMHGIYRERCGGDNYTLEWLEDPANHEDENLAEGFRFHLNRRR